MPDYTFESFQEGVDALERLGLSARRIFDGLYDLVPSEIPDGYPRLPESGVPLGVATLFGDGALVFCNVYAHAVALKHRRLEAMLQTKS